MKYLFLQMFVGFLGAMFLLFLFQTEEFLPFDDEENINWYNVFSVLFFLFIFTQAVVSIILFLFQKFLTCGIKEFPSCKNSLKWGIVISFLFVFILFLNVYNFITFMWGLAVMAFILFLLILIKF